MELDDICMGIKENIDYPIDTNLYQHNYYYTIFFSTHGSSTFQQFYMILVI